CAQSWSCRRRPCRRRSSEPSVSCVWLPCCGVPCHTRAIVRVKPSQFVAQFGRKQDDGANVRRPLGSPPPTRSVAGGGQGGGGLARYAQMPACARSNLGFHFSASPNRRRVG